jgi:hypothetical protein
MIGGVIALLGVAGQIYLMVVYRLHGEPDPGQARQAIIARLRGTEIGADFEILSAWDEYMYPTAHTRRFEILNDAVKRFPDSPRLQFRLGALTEGARSVEALKKVARLDPGNALPLYLLASEAASRKSWDEALSLLREGNRREGCTLYPLRYSDLGDGGISEFTVVACALAMGNTEVHMRLRELARTLAGRTPTLQAGGHQDEALMTLSDIRRMARKLIHAERANMMDLLMGTAIIRLAHKYEAPIYEGMGDQSGLERIAREKRELIYLQAGSHAYFDRLIPQLERSMGKYMSPGLAAASAPVMACLTAISLIWWAVFARRARRRTASNLHEEIAARVFTSGKLIRLYLGTLVLPGILCAAAFYFSMSSGNWTGGVIAAWAAVVVPCLVLMLPTRAYRREYRKAAAEAGVDVPKRWKNWPVEEKREETRRLSGVHGGAMIFVLVWALLVTGGTKAAIGTYPWQLGPAMYAPFEWEERYVKDLLAGKVEVPEKYIREAEKDEARAKARSKRPTSNIERPTSSGQKAH